MTIDALARVAQQQLPRHPVYILSFEDLGMPADCCGWSHPTLDCQLKTWLMERGMWRGRGYAVVLDTQAHDAEGTAIHELGHLLTFPEPITPEARVVELFADVGCSTGDEVLRRSSSFTGHLRVPPWHGHGSDHIRASLHAWSRWPVDVPLTDMGVAGAQYGLSPVWSYLEALRGELEEHRTEPIRELLGTAPPVQFDELFRSDTQGWDDGRE